MYNRRQVQPSTVDLKIPELEDNSDQDQFADLDTFISHHNMHQENERIHQEYFGTPQNLSDDEYYAEIDRADFRNHTLASPYRPASMSPRNTKTTTSRHSMTIH